MAMSMASTFPRKTLLFLLHSRFFGSPTTLPRPAIDDVPHLQFVVDYLVSTCGLPRDSAISVAPKLRKIVPDNTQKPDSAVGFFKSCGLGQTQIAAVVTKSPAILFSDVGNTIGPKIEYFDRVGLPRDLVVDMIVRNTQLFKRNMSCIKPAFEFLLSYLGNMDAVVATLWRSSRMLIEDPRMSLQGNVDVMTAEGVTKKTISRLIVMQPRVLLQHSDWMIKIIRFVKDIGFDPGTLMFVHAVRVMASMSESSWDKKIRVFRSLGFSEADILHMFKREPQCFVTSEEKLRKVVDFFVNTVRIEVKDLARRPKFILYRIDKRLRPRYYFFEALISKNLVPKHRNVLTVLDLTEKKFSEDYVIKFLDKVPEMMGILIAAGIVVRNS